MNQVAKKYKNRVQRITPGKIKAVHTVGTGIYGDKETFVEDYLKPKFNKEHVSDLTDNEAILIINMLGKKLDQMKRDPDAGSEKPKVVKTSGSGLKLTKKKKGAEHISPAQEQRIEILRDILHWEPHRVTGFIVRQIPRMQSPNVIPHLTMLSMDEAKTVIIGMTKVASGITHIPYNDLNSMDNKKLRGLYDRQ